MIALGRTATPGNHQEPTEIPSDHYTQSHNDQLQCHLSSEFTSLGNLAPIGPTIVDVNYVGA